MTPLGARRVNAPTEDGFRDKALPSGQALKGMWAVFTAVCTAAVLLAVSMGLIVASHWPLVHDAPLMHYVVFLMDHGFAPYRDLVEINMPGSYMQEWAVMHTLGGGAHAWFAWDALTGCTAILAGLWIAGPDRRWAGATGASLAYLIHLSDGAWDLGQRDWIVAVLLLLAFGSTAHCIRNSRSWWMAPAVCFCTFATCIKPLVVVAPFLILGAVLIQQRRQRKPLAPPILWSLAGAMPPLFAMLLFLARWGVWREFLVTLRGIVAYYAGLQALGFPALLRIALTPTIAVFTVGGTVLFLLNRIWRSASSPVSSLLAIGTALGFAFFFLQRKGWAYHRYTALAFLLIWIMVEIDTALRNRQPALRYAAVALLLVGAFAVPAKLLSVERSNRYPMETLNHLQQDLTRFGGARLSGNVQCLDMALGGCINALYRMQLVQSTGFIYDFYLFPRQNIPVTEQLQARFLSEMTKKTPEVIILSSQQWPGDAYGYDHLSRWPAFQRFLKDGYTLASSYQADEHHPSIGYELFRRK